MSIIFSWVGSIFLVILMGILIYRTSIKYQLKQVKEKKITSVVGKKKLRHIKQREQEKHVHSLMLWGIGVTLFLFFFYFFTLTLHQKNNMLTSQLIQTKEEVQSLKTEQKQFLQQLPVMDYPENGLRIGNDQWQALLSEKDHRKLQGEMEQRLAQNLTPYLGLSTVILTIDYTTNQIELTIQNEERETLVMKDVTSKIVKDFTKITEVKDICFQSVGFVDGKMQKTGQWQYSRKDTGDFVLVTDEN